MAVVTCFVTAVMLVGPVGSELDEAKKAWQQIRGQRPACVKVTYDAEWPKHNGQDHDRFEFKRCGKNMSLLEQRDGTFEGKNTKENSCWVVNDRYAFVVCRIPDESRWILHRFAQAGTDLYAALEERLRLHDLTCTLKGVQVIDTRLWEIVNNTDCQFTEVNGAPDLYRLEFRQKGDEPFQNEVGFPCREREGTIILNRKRGWTVESAVVTSFNGIETTTRYAYGNLSDGYPIETVMQYDGNTIVRRCTPDESAPVAGDFFLTAFALPEPDDTTANLHDGVEASISPDGTSLIVKVTNRSSQSLRVIGNPNVCGSGGCVVSLRGTELSRLSAMARGESQILTFKLQRDPTRPLSCYTLLRIDDEGTLRCLKVWVKGDGNDLRTTVEDTAIE
jgi:hypothetical protein